MLPSAVADSAAAASRAGYPFEICGALIGRFDGDTVLVGRVVAFPNSAEESQRRRRFVIDPLLIVQLERDLRRTSDSLVGFYHSHPDHEAAPSATDLEYFRLWPQTVWLIIPVDHGTPGKERAWSLEDPEAEKATELDVCEA